MMNTQGTHPARPPGQPAGEAQIENLKKKQNLLQKVLSKANTIKLFGPVPARRASNAGHQNGLTGAARGISRVGRGGRGGRGQQHQLTQPYTT